MIHTASQLIARLLLLMAALGAALPPQLAFACPCAAAAELAAGELAAGGDLSDVPPCCQAKRAHRQSTTTTTSTATRPLTTCCIVPDECECDSCGRLVSTPPLTREADKRIALDGRLTTDSFSYAPLPVAATNHNGVSMGLTDWRASRGHPVGLNAQTLFCVWTL